MTVKQGPKPLESPVDTARVDSLLASIGLEHGRRATRTSAWAGGSRVPSLKPALTTRPKNDDSPGLERVPGWEKYAWLQAAFSTRLNGSSTVYNSEGRKELNLGWTKDDDPEAVRENRDRFLHAVTGGATDSELVTVRQTHTPIVRLVKDGHGPLATAEGKAQLRGDALMTNLPGLVLGVQTADCVPVFVVDTEKRVVAAFHAGWRGTVARIVERGVGTMQLEYGSRPRDLIAAIGPAIGSCCYSVGQELRSEFESQFGYAPSLFHEAYAAAPARGNSLQLHLDLHEANRRQLLDAGVRAKKITVLGQCTACTRLKNGQLKYFTHRGEAGFTGRMISAIGIAT
ncbi:MAG: peptidoglycan editing factor PgeF [Acidobacteriaceae bacterium]|nr:peptidoglycan editing factor PgeF [Acidobacteriaceae bacterium]